jgi:NAD(P)H-nitrite reductase large subunit
LTADKIILRPESFYKEHNIELQLGKEVIYKSQFKLSEELILKATSVDPASKCVKFSDGSALNYDCLLLATGAK